MATIFFKVRDGRKNVDTSTWKPSECPLWATVLHSWALLHIWPCQSVTVPFFSRISRPKLSRKNWSWRSYRKKKKRFPFFFSVDPRTLLLIIVLPQNHWCIGTKNIQYWGQNFCLKEGGHYLKEGGHYLNKIYHLLKWTVLAKVQG